MSRKPEMSSAEVWKIYPRDPRFRVSSLGRVQFKDKPPKQIKARKNGYFYVCTYLHKKIQYGVHLMVVETFSGARPGKMTCSHLDGNPSNNRADNLAWETHKDNCARKLQHGTAQSGERNPAAKLTAQEVNDIRRIKLSSRDIAPIYGVSHSLVRMLRQRKVWA